MLRIFVLTVISVILVESISPPQYLGGYITSTVRLDNGKYMADVELVTRWVVKTGPCGTRCDQSKVGTSTLSYRNLVEAVSHNKYFFGLFSLVSQKSADLYERRVINDVVDLVMNETVVAVSDEWEEELMTFTVEVDNTYVDKSIRFDGYSWKDLSVQGPDIHWNLQTDIVAGIRSDTQKPNTSPTFVSKRIYRTQLNSWTTMKIVSYDDDGDVISCYNDFSTSTVGLQQVPGVVVRQDCTLDIDASSNYGYTNDTYIAIPVILKEFPVQTMNVGNNIYGATSSIATSGLQFVIHMLDNIQVPEFVNDTRDTGHEFLIIENEYWTNNVYAKSGTGRSITEFKLTTRGSETISKSPIFPDPSSRDRTKFVTVSWKPTRQDVGRHIVCITAVDDVGTTTVDDVCYILNVLQKVQLIGPPFANKQITIGDPINLDCFITGTNTPVFYWKKINGCHDHVESFKSSVLNVTSHATIGDEGTYICTGSDGMYQNVTKQFNVKIIRGIDYSTVCDFENGTCGWTQNINNTMDWAILNGPTGTPNTGPDSDHTWSNSSGNYLYIETSSPTQQNDSASFISPVLPANHTICFEYWYHMYGDGIGKLLVYIQDSCSLAKTLLFDAYGEQGDQWLENFHTIDDTMIPNDYRIIIEGVAGLSYRGDIAIDDIVIADGTCQATGQIIIG
ncbi:hypothetical protein ACF0H5_009859 [Mactra antiquata]